MGISLAANAGREQTALLADCPRASLEGAVELLCDAAVRPRIEQWRVDAEVVRLKAAWEALLQDPQSYTLEAASTVAFDGALGASLVPSKRDLEHGALAEEVEAWHAATFRAGSVVLAVSGAEVEEVAHVAAELLAELPEGEAPAPPSSYKGGYHCESMGGDGLAHALLAYEFKGGWRDVRGSVAATVLQMLMGGGGSFSSGGPGKGMHSRLYRRVLNNCPWVANCTAVSSLYNDTGLVGVFGSAEPSRADELVGLMSKELEAVANGGVTEEELTRAKNSAAASIQMNLESKAIVCEDVGRQLLTYGQRTGGEEFVAEVHKVTKADVEKVVKDMLKSAPTFVACGEVSQMPSYETLARRG